MNAHRINAGEMVEPRPGSRDFLFIKRDNPGNIIGATITLLKDKLPNYVNSSTRDIQVLTPMRKRSSWCGTAKMLLCRKH